MKSAIYNSCKTLAKTAVAASLSVSLLSASVFAQEAPAKISPNQDIQLQKVDGPRKTGRKRSADSNRQLPAAERPGNQQGGTGDRPQSIRLQDSANTPGGPTIRRIDADKVQELRSRIRTERSSRIRNVKFQEERAKNVRRLVQIERVRQLAEESEKPELVERANQLRDKEIQRHTLTLAKLRHDNVERQNSNRPLIEKSDSKQDQ